MPRKPPRQASKGRGPRATKDLPERSDARVTWGGAPPQQRTKGRWSGSVSFEGKKRHVGTFDTPRQWGQARDALLKTLKEQRRQRRAPGTPLEGATVAQFVGPPGKKWPWDFKRNGRRKVVGTMNHHEQCIRAFLASFGERLIKGGIDPEEAELWANDATENQLTSAIAMFNDARSRDRSVVNPLHGLSRQRTRGRRDLPDVLTVDEFELLKRVARRCHPGLYAPVIQAMVHLEGTSAPRPGELWALERPELVAERGEVYINSAVKKDGTLGPPKYGQRRWMVLDPSAMEALLGLPVLHERWFFPTKTGRPMTQSNWTTYWHPVRDAFTMLLSDDHWLVRRIARCVEARAAEPDATKHRRMSDGKLDFYELRHRAITYMVTPKPDGLGMDSSDVAYQVGHSDGGRLIEEVYVHRNPELARARMRRAMGYREKTA